jgi:hypothetical protein
MLLAAEDDVLLGHRRGKAGAIKVRSRRLGASSIPGVPFTIDRTMNQMHDIRYGLKRNLGPVEGATAGSGAGCEKSVATFLPIEARLGLIRGATRLVQYLLDL